MFLFAFFVPSVQAQSVCDIPGINSEACKAIDLLFTKKQADGPWYNQNFGQFSRKVLDEKNPDAIFGERYTFAQINWIVNSIATMLNPAANIQNAGDLFNFIIEVQKLLKAEVPPTMSDYAKLGPAGLFTGGMTALYSNPPASAVSETKYLASRVFDFGTGTTPVYAAEGYGYAGLSSGGAVRALWTASRNMSYLIIVVILIASGFMIMFRVKINPQTVVSLQTMIPKLVTTLILITFSFAIAGLVIDMIYVFLLAIIGLLSTSQFISNVPAFIKTITEMHILQGYAAIQILPTFILAFVVTLILAWTAAGFTAGTSFLIGAVIMAIVFIYFLINLWKIFWMLLKAYVMIILQICIAPLQIMLDLLPGQSGFGPWIRNLIANASVFVAVPVMLLLQLILSWNPITNYIIGINVQGGIDTKLALPLLGGGSGELGLLMSVGIGFVIFSLTPKIADMIRDALKVPAFKYESAIGEAFMEPYKWYQGAVGMQKSREEEALMGKKLAEAGIKSRQALSGGVTGEYSRGREAAEASSPKAKSAMDLTRKSDYSGK